MDNKNKPVIGAKVLIVTLNKADITNTQGNFIIDDLTQNTFEVEISCIGYKTLTQQIELTENNKIVFQLETALVKLDGVVV